MKGIILAGGSGTQCSFIEVSTFIKVIEGRQGLKIGCLKEITLENGWIGEGEIRKAAATMGKNSYADYLRRLLGAN